MLRLFGPDCPIAPLAADRLAGLPCVPAWIDLLDPSDEEIAATEALIGTALPRREERIEIEPSSRLYERRGALFVTASVLYGVREGKPASDPVTFVLTERHLVTLRRIDPKPLIHFAEDAYADPDLVADPRSALIGLLDAMIDRLADEIEDSAQAIELVSHRIFQSRLDRHKRSTEGRLEALLIRLGRIQGLLAKIRDTAMSMARLLSFLDGCRALSDDDKVQSAIAVLATDVRALSDHTNFHNDNVTFLLDATLGLVSLEQNTVMKIFSVFAVVLMPPTLVAGIYGMNFQHMPELAHRWGYPVALVAMIASATLPYLWARRRGWL